MCEGGLWLGSRSLMMCRTAQLALLVFGAGLAQLPALADSAIAPFEPLPQPLTLQDALQLIREHLGTLQQRFDDTLTRVQLGEERFTRGQQ